MFPQATNPINNNKGEQFMARLIRNAERITRARALIQKARDIPPPTDMGMATFSYVAEVKELLRKARDLVKFIPMSPSATSDIKDEAEQIMNEIEQAQKEATRFL
jgi:hypothetical protein